MTSTQELMDAYQTLKAQADTIKEQMDQIKAQLAEALPEGGTVGDHKVSIVRGRVSWPRIAKAYPADAFPQLYKQEVVIDPKTAERLIAPAQLDEYRGAPSVSIR